MAQQVEVSDDDICISCDLLLYDPVNTECNHVLCRSCMATSADVSTAIVSVDDDSADFDFNVDFDAATGVEIGCPACRTQTTATTDRARAASLRARYPIAYAEREHEEAQREHDQNGPQPVTICIGNRHRLIDAPSGDKRNKHEWTFFVRPSRTDIVEKVHVLLHRCFPQNRVVCTHAPFEVKRLGWCFFTISFDIILKAGFRWVSSDARDSPDGVRQGSLPLHWELDFYSFDGQGAMRRCRYYVSDNPKWEDVSDGEERHLAEWNSMVRIP